MANNRLYLLDTETNEGILLAKGFGAWSLRADEPSLADWIHGRDYGAALTGDVPSVLKLVTENGLPEGVAIYPDERKKWWPPHDREGVDE